MQEYHKGFLRNVSDLYSQHEEGTVFVTEKISYRMREVTKRARKNYLGIYDEPYDPITGEEKYFPPLTETFSDGVIKSIDIDTKDIDLYSTNGSNVGASKILRTIVRQKLKEANFGETLNEMIRYLVIDGSAALKFSDEYDPVKKKRKMCIKAVDNLNLVADQSADSLSCASGVIERSLLTQEELRQKADVWYDIDKVIKQGASETSYAKYSFLGNSVQTSAPYYPVYDYWGQVEEYCITGEEAGKGKWVEGHAVIANLHDPGKACVLLLEKNEKGHRPYEDVAIKKVIGRRQGRGVPEMLFGTQKYMNMLIEIRKKNAQILQNGLFKAKRGMGLTADSIISKLSTGGIITVTDMDDFQQMPIDDSRTSNYQDEDRLLAWGERNTGMFDVRRGEAMAASAPATTQLIQDRNSRDLFQLVQENIGLMLERFIERHVLPWVIENVSKEETIMITGSLKDLEEFDSVIAEHLVHKELLAYVERHSVYPRPEEVVAAKEKQMAAFRKLGKRRYIDVQKKMFAGAEVGIDVVVTNESVDRATILQKLQEVLTLAIGSGGALKIDAQGVVDTIFDIMNVPTDRIYATREVYQTPIEKIKKGLETAAAAAATQPLNKVTGAVAPQQNAARTPATEGVNRALTRQSQQNVTQLTR